MKGIFKNTLEFFKMLAFEFMDKGCQKSAAALTYMSLFALVPMMTVMYSMFSLVPAFDGVADKLQSIVFANFVPEAGQEVQSYLSSFSEQARSLTGFGVAILAVTAYLMLTNIEKTFNTIWGVKQSRRGLTGFLLYWAVLSIGPLMLGAGLVVSTYILSIKLFASELVSSGLVSFAFRLLPIFMAGTAFTLLFAAVPNCKVPIRHALLGGMLTAVCFEMVKSLFTYIVANSSFKLVYGAFAVVPLFLLWINVLWTIVLAGAVLVRTLTERKYARGVARMTNMQAALECLNVFRQKSMLGEYVSDQDCVAKGIGLVGWQSLRAVLVENHIIAVTESGHYVLRQDLSSISLWELACIMKASLPDIERSEEVKEEEVLQSWRLNYSEKEQQISATAKKVLGISIADLLDIRD